jgi:glycosyltransferase involved in cell wall biosynthesis
MTNKIIAKSWKALLEEKKKYNDYEFPAVSVIIPTFNSTEKISLTLKTVLEQIYPDFEIIIVDAGSIDRTLEVVKNYRDERIKLYSVAGYQRYEMLNKGISQAKGEYINCLFPGDFYIHEKALSQIMEVVLDNEKPSLVYCGTLIRDGKSDPKVLFRPFTLSLLKKGQQPTSLQSCWFRRETLRSLGKFNTSYQMRGGFELMCRFRLARGLREKSTPLVLTDYDLRLVTRSMVWCHFIETLRTLHSFFGIIPTIKWLFIQKDFFRIIQIWWKSIKAAFIGR